MSRLFTRVPIGRMTAATRLFVAPVTRSRAGGPGVPGARTDCPARLP
jgi:2,4-dienoyl-CoA reductase-like NADH-dependent reductase (Old Yellow Enzyme family)